MKKTKAIVIGIGVFVLIFAVIGVLIYYSYTQIHVNLNDVSYHSIEWETFSWSVLLNLGLNVLSGNWLSTAFDLIQGISFDLTFGLYNEGLLPVYIPDLSYDLLINNVHVGKGYSKVDTTIYPGQTKEISVLQNFQKSSLYPVVGSIASNEGVVNLKVSGTAYFKLFIFDIPIHFESTKSISIKDEIKSRLESEIQKNQQNTANSISNSIKQSINNGLESIKNTIDNAMNVFEQEPQQKSESKTGKIQTTIYLENIKNTHEGQTVTFVGSLFYNKDGMLYGVPNAKIGVLADWQMPYYPPNQDPFVGFTYTDQYGKFKISWTAKENPLTNSGYVSTWSPRAYFFGNEKFEQSEGGMGLVTFQVKKS